MTRGAFVFLATFGLVAPAAADGPFANKGLKLYPKSEARYIKQFAGPTISPCGPCFGYYRTQWRSWGEACNEPQPVDPGPQKYVPPPEPVPEPEKLGTPAVPKIDAGPKPPEKKEPPVLQPDKKEPLPEKKDPPKLDIPMPKAEVPQVNTTVVVPVVKLAEPAVPAAPAPPPVPLPTVIVPIGR